MKKISLFLLNILFLISSLGVCSLAKSNILAINGAGATFPYPIYSKWFDEYQKIRKNVQINYQSIGSGGGIRQITEHTVDFGATDMPMTDEQLDKLNNNILHIPTVLGAVVPIYNLQGIENLNLTGEILADIYLNKIKKWNDPKLVEINKDLKLPGENIVVVHRADGSGTTYCFVDYLSEISNEWKEKVGKGTAVNWPIGIGGKGNEGVSGLVKQTPNSIGYVELIYAEHNNLRHAAVKNLSGKFVKATTKSVAEAAKDIVKNLSKDFRVSIINAKGDMCYPISTFTWLLVYNSYDEKKAQTIKEFLVWMLNEGQQFAPRLGYSPLPNEVRDLVRVAINKIKSSNQLAAKAKD